MTPEAPADAPHDPGEISPEQASVFLHLGLGGSRRPVDELIDRLRASDGAAWLDDALASGPLRGEGSPADVLIGGRSSLEQLIRFKERSKLMIRAAADRQSRLAGIAGYLFSVAAALRHHGALITDRDRREVDAVLLDLAEAAPDSFGRLAGEAVVGSEAG